MNIIYKRDDNLMYKKDILAGLVAFNKTFAGDAPSRIMNIYVLDNGKLVGACHTEEEWNWLYILSVFYQDKNVLKVMMNELYKYFHDKVEGIIYESHINESISEFKEAGFETLGIMENKPMGFDSHVLINKNQTEKQVSHNFEVKVLDEKHEAYSKILEEKENAYNEEHNIDETTINIEYVALDNDKFVGGVFGYIAEDYLYVSLLWVDEKYRGHQIASNLMDKIENEAVEKGYKQFYLGTCTFQALEFYEKRGYSVKMIVNNCPVGYDDYLMIKNVKEPQSQWMKLRFLYYLLLPFALPLLPLFDSELPLGSSSLEVSFSTSISTSSCSSSLPFLKFFISNMISFTDLVDHAS